MNLHLGIVKVLVVLTIFLTALFNFGCSDEIVPEAYYPSSAHDAYKHSLEEANLAETAIGGDWIAASQTAFSNPVEIDLPFQESFYVDSTSAFASAYLFEVLYGQKVEVKIEFTGRQSVRLFIDLFRVTNDTANAFVHVASADKNENRLEFEPRNDADYILRLQPELLRGGRCKVIIRRMPAVGFPVSGSDESNIQSFFGAPRDGGRRVHHGVDIFAPRHTPVIAPAPGRVRFVGERGIGGNVVWLRDSKRYLNYYFAHLQTQNVERYENVEAGDTLGTVGNSGNARTTPPHLHFGIYVQGRGPVDPINFFSKTNTIPHRITAEENLIGEWVRSTPSSVLLRSASGVGNGHALGKNSAMKVMAASGGMYRVKLPDGVSGYLPAAQVELLNKPLLQRFADERIIVKDNPFENSISIEVIDTGKSFDVLGKFNGHWLVVNETKSGWTEIVGLN